MPSRPIRTAHDARLPADRQAEGIFDHWPPDTPFVPPSDLARDAAVVAFVNDGRWLAECPCGAAQLVSQSDRRYFCVDCMNQYAGGRWVRVAWPDDVTVEAIEALLVRRPFPDTRNWLPHETITDLFVENVTHGVGGIDAPGPVPKPSPAAHPQPPRGA
jgi:hypothetical protein